MTLASILKFEWLTDPLSAYRNYRRRTEELARILRHERSAKQQQRRSVGKRALIWLLFGSSLLELAFARAFARESPLLRGIQPPQPEGRCQWEAQLAASASHWHAPQKSCAQSLRAGSPGLGDVTPARPPVHWQRRQLGVTSIWIRLQPAGAAGTEAATVTPSGDGDKARGRASEHSDWSRVQGTTRGALLIA